MTPACAAEPSKITILHSGFPNRTLIHLLIEALAKLGYENNRTAKIELLGGEGDPNRLKVLVAQLGAQRPDVIIAITSPAACDSMWSLTLPSMGPTSGAEKFCSSAKKDFFDSIDPEQTSVNVLSLHPIEHCRGGSGDMRRRDVITLASGATLAWLPFARAQQSSHKVWRLAFLNSDSWESEVQRALFEIFQDELRKLGYVDGKNLVIERRAAEGRYERLDQLANELIALRPDVLVAVAAPAIAAAQRATATTPIVMWGVGDAVALGFIKSLAHPGGNLTGVATMFSDTIGKSLELLHSILPAATRVAVLGSSNPGHKRLFEQTAAAAKTLGLVMIPISASSPDDLGQAFENMVQEKCDALFVLADPIKPEIVSLAASKKMPAIYQFSAYVDLGGLASYGASLALMGRQTARYAAKIFQGAKPAELPVEQPVAFELVLNLKTAAALGLSIPTAVIARADKVIE